MWIIAGSDVVVGGDELAGGRIELLGIFIERQIARPLRASLARHWQQTAVVRIPLGILRCRHPADVPFDVGVDEVLPRHAPGRECLFELRLVLSAGHAQRGQIRRAAGFVADPLQGVSAAIRWVFVQNRPVPRMLDGELR